jgi:hypothetical protein
VRARDHHRRNGSCRIGQERRGRRQTRPHQSALQRRQHEAQPEQANASGASSFRLQSASFETIVYALPPVIQIPKVRGGEGRTLVIERTNRPNERFAVEIDESLANGGFYDLAKADIRLRRGALYTATFGSRKFTFKVDAKAKTGNAPVVSRLLRFPPG